MNKKTFVILTLLALAFFCPLPKNITAAGSIETPATYGVGQWLPSDQLFLDQWMATLTEGAESANEPLLPVIQEFKNIIEEDPQLFMLFNQMFDQVPR
ncbi:MAG: phophatidylserine decarboxylase associated domain-containing protein, partial [Desulfatirhabdiaceae bacterium]|nr:phophatidylserine decarboxylase associated domain-containing protein [Desulfatirhabdiaceae bacterium]